MSERSERMEITSTALLDDIDLALRANNNGAPIAWRQDMCMCDPSVGMVPCQYCAIQNALEKCKRFLSSNTRIADTGGANAIKANAEHDTRQQQNDQGGKTP